MSYLLPICGYCGQDTRLATITTCVANYQIIFPDGSTLPAKLWEGPGRCLDCNVQPLGFHHPGCTYEICPKCGDPLEQCTDLG